MIPKRIKLKNKISVSKNVLLDFDDSDFQKKKTKKLNFF